MFKKLFHWDNGRQKSGYDKMLLCFALYPFKFDVYLLRFPTGSKIPPHIDQVKNGKHFRLNIILKNAKNGGKFICKDPIFETKRIKLFRPDISEHQVTEIIGGNRYVFSVGWIRK
jgi:hypothetical protein